MKPIPRPISILCADDDPEDRMLMKEAWDESRIANELHFVEDGEELMDYLYRRGKFAHLAAEPMPGMILLDLNMPKMDGREALQQIKGNPQFAAIPTVVLTTSKAEEDIVRAYSLGVNSFIVKPVTFQSLVELTLAFSRYWFEIVELPPRENAA